MFIIKFVAFFDHIFYCDGIKVDSWNFEVVENFPRPLSPLDNESSFSFSTTIQCIWKDFLLLIHLSR